MFGRHDEKELLDEALTGARGGNGRCIVFVGDAGSGKSTLLRHAMSTANPGFRVIELTGVETESKLLWSGLTTLLWPLRELIPRLPDTVSEPLRRLLHGDIGPTRLDPLSVGVAVLHLLSLAAEHTPCMVVADDLQWLDWPTAQILRFVTRRLGEDPIVFVGALRPIAPFAMETGVSTEWPGSTALQGLDGEHVAELFAALGRTVTPSVCRELADRTSGHPLALAELAALLTDPQLLGSEPLPSALPVSQLVRDRVATQLSVLPERTRRALLVLSLDPTMCRPQAMRMFDAAGVDESDVEPAFTIGLTTSALAGARLVHPLVRAAVVQLPSRPLLKKSFPTSYPSRFCLWYMSCNLRSSSEEAIYSIPQALHFFCTSWPRLICICVRRGLLLLPSFLVKDGVGFLVRRALSLVETRAFRLPRTEKALLIGIEGFEGVSFFLGLLVLSHGNSGGDEGGLDAMRSSEKMVLSLGMGVDDMLVEGVDM